MTRKKSKYFLIIVFMSVICAVICGRLFMLTVVSHNKWQEYSDSLSQKVIYRSAPRGDILDRKGRKLATAKVENSEEGYKEYVRYYPYGSVASHILGYIGNISADEKNRDTDRLYRNDSLVGKYGIEKEMEKSLKGIDGKEIRQVDSRGKITKFLGKTAAKKGRDVKLTIDLHLQKVSEEALQEAITQASVGGIFTSDYGNVQMTYGKNAASGAVVVLDVKTADVLAMASVPDFNPNDFVKGITDGKWDDLQQTNPMDPLSPAPLYNIATMTAVQPGSTFKPVTALAALSCGLDPSLELYDDGFVEKGGRKFGCFLWNERGGNHGYLNLAQAMRVSCNYYFYDIATGRDQFTGKTLDYEKKISNKTISGYAKKLGLGEKTGIQLEENHGTTPSEDLKARGIKNSLREYLIGRQETFFTEQILSDRKLFYKKIEKIVNWADKDLTLKEIIGKLKREKCIRHKMVGELAQVCLYTYFSQMKWSIGDTFNISIGQGDNSYTTLQMANYMATLGNDGKRNRVNLIYNNDHGEDIFVDSGIDRKHIKRIISAMTEVTSSPEGSLYNLFDQFPYSVAAKTGTAQRAGKKDITGEKEYLRRYLHLIAPDVGFRDMEQEAKRLMNKYPEVYDNNKKAIRRAVMNISSLNITGEDIDRYKESYDSFAWTVALAPADEPKIAVAVMMIQGKTSLNAAPVVREIIGKCGEIFKWEKLF